MGMRTHPGEVYSQNEKAKDRKATLLRLFKLVMEEYKFSFIVVFACIIVSSCATLMSTLFTKTLIDDYIKPLQGVDNPDFSPLAVALLKLAAVLVVGVVCAYTYNRIMISISQGTMLRLRKNMFKHMQTLPIKYFDTHAHGDIMSTYTNDVDSLRQVLSSSLPSAFSSLITLAITFASMVVLSIPLTCVSIVMAIVMVRATTYLGKMSRKHFVAQQQNLANVNGFIEEMLTGQKVVKVFCYEQ
ncbi:MAG: ABC transporter ATP-binding protein, partial [Prevotella sp.]|nr:ABC transporter ATP-binding protein [Prevotella sp.]